MKTFIYKIFLLFFPLFFMLVSVNYYGDAANLFSSNYEKEMASILKSGSFVTNIYDYDERTLQKELIQTFRETPEIVVIGSSRAMLIDQEMFSGKTFFNNSVSGANFKDLIAIYQLYKEKKFMPSEIILGIDPWMFNNNESDNRWKSLAKQYNSFYSKNSKSNFLANGSIYKWSQLFSLSYFQVSLRLLDDKLRSGANPLASDSMYNQSNTIMLDGSLVYGEAHRTAPIEEVKVKINMYIEGDKYGMKGFDGSYTEGMKVLKELCNDMLRNNIEIKFFLSPYPLKSYEALTGKYPSIMSLENKIKQYAKVENIKVIGSFNPNKFELDDAYFYDGAHCKKEAIIKLFNANSFHVSF